MKAEIDVFRKKDPLQHEWQKHAVSETPKEKYDVYFKNRYLENNAFEEYDELQQLEDNYIAYTQYGSEINDVYSY